MTTTGGPDAATAAGRMDPLPSIMIAVDGGGSKTDVLAVAEDGEVLAHARGAGSNPQVLGLEQSTAIVGRAVEQVRREVGPHRLRRMGLYIAGLDLPAELVAFRSAVDAAPWAGGLSGDEVLIDNDLFALLRAGTSSSDAVALVCGTGINAVATRADGRTVRFPALGAISGDWGGGGTLGMQALWHAARSEDGRGPKSVLETLVPEAFGVPTVMEVIEGLHFGRISHRSIAHLTPLLLTAARTGDPLALADIDHQAEEILTMAVTAMRRLDLLDSPVRVVLGGGVLAAGDPLLIDPVLAGLAARAPLAVAELVTTPPIVGAALLVLESVDAGEEFVARAREGISRLFRTGEIAASYEGSAPLFMR